MGKGTKRALIFGAIPFLTLVFALPFVNRVEPFVLGLPFVLFWILLWVALTPVSLFLAYKVEKKYNPLNSDTTPDPSLSPEARSGPAAFRTTGPADTSGAPARTSTFLPRNEAPK